MRLRAGTSGYAYKEWKGSFYPEGLRQDRMLAHYAGRLPTVEINNTFYRMPRRSVLEAWGEQVPEGFRLVLKASRRITHFKRLVDTGEETAYLLETVAAGLGSKAGAILFQLPPNFKADVGKLDAFLEALPAARRAAFEFRHPSWFEDEVYACLERHGSALCAAETDDTPAPERLRTADWGYLRLRKTTYGGDELRDWLQRIRDQEWSEAYVFFKHEEAGSGPALAEELQALAAT